MNIQNFDVNNENLWASGYEKCHKEHNLFDINEKLTFLKN